MKLYEVKALAHETQSRIRQDLNAWNDFLEHASRVYRYRFMDQILIYAQRPDAVACATMNIWNSKMGCWIKKGNRGIALIDESNSRKLKYVWDVASVVPKMGGHLPRLWIRKPYHTETIQNRLLKVYGLQPQTDKYDTKEPSIEHTMDYLVEYLADEYAADIAQEKYSSENSPLSELDEEKYKMDEYRRNVRFFFRYGLNRMIKERMGLSTGGFSDYDMSFIKDLPESDFCELSSRMTDAAQQALREVGIAVLTYDRVHGIDRDPNVDYNALKRKSTEREDKTYGTRIHQSRGLRDTEPYTEQGTTGAADEIRTYAQDLAQKELQGQVRYDANVRGTSGTLPGGTEESTGRDGQNRAADEKTGRSDRAAEDAGPAEMDKNDEQHPEQGRGNSEGYSGLHFIENEIVPESGTSEDEYVPESGTGLYFMPELPTEDEQRIKVEKYGYLNPRKADYIPHDYIRQVMLRGTGFEGGFARVTQIFQNEMEAGKRTALIKKEYGLGGASWPVDGMGLHGYDTYGSQGIRFQWRDEQGEAEGTLSWSSVEQEIGILILTGEYRSRDRQNNDIIQEAEESDNISQTTEMQEQSTDKHKSEAPEQLSFTDFINIEPDKTENDTQPEALDETEAEHPDNAEQQNNEDFTERAADYTALLVLAEADASTLTKRQKAQRNISALKILKQIENKKRPATADERTIMSAYLGWGGIPEIFDAENASWSEEYGILKSLLTITEYDSARASTLNAHFTDKSVIDAMYKVLNNLGFTKGNILEPSMGIGNFFSGLPADMSASKLYGVELDPVTGIELAPEGTGYRAKTRFAKFFNLPELISLFKESADIQTADMLKLPVPECDYENVVLKPSEFQQEIVKSLGDRAENIRNGGVDSSIDNMLKVTSDGRKCAIDQRLINPDLPDNENSKVNACAARAYDIWKETAEDKSTQLIFCDASTPRSDGGFDVYHAIKDKLIAKGVPDKEIAFIHDANTKKQKAELFSKVRSGQVRFLLGSTAKMGAGTNVQTRLIALHHIDVPWRPSDIEQQEGRILRQGNRNERVKIFRYVTENTFDSYSWQLIENKQKFIGQIMTSKSPVRSCDDVDEAALSYAEVKALATGNPYIKEKMTLDTEVAKLKLLKANFKSQKYRLEDAINKEYPVRIAKLEEKIEGLRQDIITRGSGEILSDGFEIRINGVPYDDKKEGGAALIAAAKESKTPERTMIGDYNGFKLYSRFDAFFNLYYIHMQGRCEHTIEMSSDPAGMITRLNNCMAGFEKRLSDAQDALDETRIELETAEKEVTKKFDKEDILSEKLKRLSFLNAQLDADRKETPQNAPQNKQAQRNDIKEKYISI